jgi:Protein of unknown function (DUF1812).
MKQRNNVYIALISLIILGCGISCQRGDIPKDDNAGYIATSLSRVNKDLVSYEDRVTEVRMLIFNASNGECLYNSQLTFPGGDLEQRSSVIKWKPGTFDFLYIANESTGGTAFVSALSEVGNIVDLEGAIFKTLNYDPDYVPTSTSGFLMSSFYKGLAVSSSTTENSPQELSVGLIRSMAKVEVIFKNVDPNTPTFKRVTEVYLENVPIYYTVPAAPDIYTAMGGNLSISKKYPNTTGNAIFTEEEYNKETIGTLIYYVPEFLRPAISTGQGATTLVIYATGILSSPVRVVLDHQNFNDNEGPRGEFNEGDYSRYSIVRGTNYQITVNMHPSAPIGTTLNVLPWTLKTTSVKYGEFGYDLKVYVGPTEVTAQNFNQRQIKILAGETVRFVFNLKEPENAVWRATLNNGGEFDFVGGSIVRGVAGEGVKEFTIKPIISGWTGVPIETEVYIVVFQNGIEEVPLIPGTDAQGSPYIGQGNRYKIIQVEQK